MPQKRNNSEPPEVMTWPKALPVLAVCAVFDVIRFMFEWFIFFGPALAALYCTVKVGDVAVVGGLLAGACVAAAGAAGVAGVEVLGPFGIVMAMATGLAGWLVVGLILVLTNFRIFKENALWFAGSLLISEVPFVGSVPAITLIVRKMYRTQIGIEKAAYKKWEKENADVRLQEQRQQEFMQAQANQLASADVY